MIPELVALLDTPCKVNRPAYAAAGAGELTSTATPAIRDVDMRIDAARGELRWVPEGKREQTTEIGFADTGADLQAGEYVGATTGNYANVTWEIVHVNPAHGDHFEVALARRFDLAATLDPLA